MWLSHSKRNSQNQSKFRWRFTLKTIGNIRKFCSYQLSVVQKTIQDQPWSIKIWKWLYFGLPTSHWKQNSTCLLLYVEQTQVTTILWVEKDKCETVMHDSNQFQHYSKKLYINHFIYSRQLVRLKPLLDVSAIIIYLLSQSITDPFDTHFYTSTQKSNIIQNS